MCALDREKAGLRTGTPDVRNEDGFVEFALCLYVEEEKVFSRGHRCPRPGLLERGVSHYVRSCEGDGGMVRYSSLKEALLSWHLVDPRDYLDHKELGLKNLQ